MGLLRTVIFYIIVVHIISFEICNGYSEDDAEDNESRTFDTKQSSRLKVADDNDNKNNHKPIFSKCSTYSPSIKEEQTRGEFVIDVHADDIDPLNNGGTINYTIVKRDGDRSYFTIDHKIGRITTNLASEFDRDEPSRLKEIYITVQATDNGRPVLADLCTFKVTILDINDNSPSFDKYDYEEKVSEDLKEGSEVMRVVAYDIDDGDNSRLTYKIRPDGTESAKNFDEYFRIEAATGVLHLKKPLTNKRDTIFNSIVVVQDNPKDPSERKESTAAIKITVVGSDKQPPTFTDISPGGKIPIAENYRDYLKPLVTLTAESNIEDPEVIFDLVKGLTTQTNKDSTFILEQKGTVAYITLGRALDYETVTEYQLTVRCTNKDSWSVIRTIDIEIEDVNDEIPQFIELVSGSVLENEEPPAEVMQVRAVDKDGTSANSKVTYELLDNKDLFAIDENNGKVTTRKKLDRELLSVYNVIITARDNSRSPLTNKDYNFATQTFRITIEDRNDNKPQFTKSYYVADRVPENSDIGKEVIEVKAVDRDTASLIHYKIVNGNIGNAFAMENTTGRIKVNALLDFEKIESYNLKVEANDGIYSDEATVHVKISNVNDELPIFEIYDKNITILEESIPDGCIINMKAYDPDIKDRLADQKILYHVGQEAEDFLTVDKDGCVMLTKAMDRDLPHGYPTRQAFIHAYDDGGAPGSKSNSAEIFIILIDINDNAPFLNMTEVVWYENEEPGRIVKLKARDLDGPENGAPFTYNLPMNVGEEIKSKFYIEGDDLYASVRFDREEQKYYSVPIEITDSGTPNTQTGVSILKVIIGDRNDNAAKSGSSEIFVYNYKGASPDVQIGRVYVEDPDDWDLQDKTFQWYDGISPQNFNLSNDGGMITMIAGTPEGNYTLSFKVTEEHLSNIPRHEVEATVVVTVKKIPEEAVRKSGSIRIYGTTIEEFVEKPSVNELSKKDILRKHLTRILNTSKEENVDVFTIIPVASNQSYVDVRFSAHGSPYYAAERLNSEISLNKDELEEQLDVKFIMININECMEETACPSKSSCRNYLNIKDEPAVVFTNKTSFVGVQAIVEAICECHIPNVVDCYNGGQLIEDAICSCPEGFDGPRCELLGIGFTGDGWAMYPPFEACNNSEIRLEVVPQNDNGLIFYVGPLAINPLPLANDFMSLELRNGFPVLLLDYGTGTTEVALDYKKLTDGLSHSIKIKFQPNEISLSVDDCGSKCLKLQAPKAPNQLLNVNGPLQVGGTRENLKHLASLLHWNFTPTNIGFNGCIRNLTYNGFVYNLGEPGEHKNAHPNCNYGVARAVSFGIDSNFLVAILVCIAILLVLLLAVVVHRRKQDNWNEKDTDDIRETIISYEDEGGGEVDTGFDLSVLRRLNDDDYPLKEKAPEVPDISGFLDTKKDNCDRDANSYPFDDVRYYAYEGDGNSTGSLSSLASCTDDGDLKFNYLSSFGPRFRKLADMYGEDPSDEDSQDGGEESWC